MKTSEAANTAIAIRQETSAVMLTNQQLQMIANTPFVPAAFRGKVPEILACVATGRALGLPDMTSLRGINVIQGKATLSAELQDAIVRSHGHSITGTVDDQKAVVRGRRADNGDTMEATFTLEMADKAGLLTKDSWRKHPDDMLWARAVSKLCRRLFADCFAGATYIPDEVELTADEVMDESPGPVPGVVWGDRPEEEEVVRRGIHSQASGLTPATWDQLVEARKQAGITDERMTTVGAELFPGRKPSTLEPEDIGRFWEALAQETIPVA